jgi:hypothetical protein
MVISYLSYAAQAPSTKVPGYGDASHRAKSRWDTSRYEVAIANNLTNFENIATSMKNARIH